jgi:diguanylate cyclase (GGDEF) domain
MDKPEVLFVDDEPHLLSAVARLFGGAPIAVLTFGDPEAALDFLLRGDVALVVSDFRMPRMNGSEFLSQVASARPRTRRILVSGQADFAELAAAVNEGSISRFIAKPWNVDDLRRIVISEAAAATLERYIGRLPAFQETIIGMDSEDEIGGAFRDFMAHSLGFAPESIVIAPEGEALGETPDGLIEVRDEGRVLRIMPRDDQLRLFRDYGDWDMFRRHVSIAARTIQVVLQRAVAREELLRLSETDALSGLGNRLALDKSLAREFARARRYGADLSLLLFDVDTFKSINDGFGHDAGDEAIRLIGEVVRKHIRSVDIGARFGGDEFVVILPEITIDAAERVAERIRSCLASSEKLPFRVTLSIGGASLDSDMSSAQELLAAADHALYAAKAGGRDRFVAASSRGKGTADRSGGES